MPDTDNIVAAESVGLTFSQLQILSTEKKNTHWGSRLFTTKGKELLSPMKENKLLGFSTRQPTY